MQAITSRKHSHSHSHSRLQVQMSAALATMLLPLAAGAAETTAPAFDDAAGAVPMAKVEVAGKSEGGFLAERPSSPKYTEKLVDTAQSVQVIRKELIEQQGALTLTEALRNTPGVGRPLGGCGRIPDAGRRWCTAASWDADRRSRCWTAAPG